jgi:deoxycytidine triphosphate deaminase
LFGRGTRSLARDCPFAGPDDEDLVRQRSQKWQIEDPFPDVAAALLSAVEIRNYVRVTGMIHPYDDDKLKAASYPAGMGGTFVRWENEKKIEEDVGSLAEIVLPPNSISFVQTNITFRLPHYVALRFNLQISHVHRGILLGTGPVVDPGFEGKLLIPLHNLTSTDYKIPVTEPLIWIEFTKTTFGRPVRQRGYDASGWERFLFPDRKKNLTPDQYFRRANNLDPLESSIPEAIRHIAADAKKAGEEASHAKNDAEAAKTAAQETKAESDKAEKRLFTIGLAGLAVLILTALGIYLQAVGVVGSAASSINDARHIIEGAQNAGAAEKAATAKINGIEERVQKLETNSVQSRNQNQSGSGNKAAQQ